MRPVPDSPRQPGLICLLTVHGIGFQQFPREPDLPGYADSLHTSLRAELGSRLGDDPRRERNEPGESGAVYVSSEWPPRSGDIELGLDRIAARGEDGRLDWHDRPLAPPGSAFAHVALVYSGLESTRPRLWLGIRALWTALLHLGRYASPLTLWRLVKRDMQAIGPMRTAPSPTNRVREDIPHRRMLPHPRKNRSLPAGSTTGDTLAQLEDDVAGYIFDKRLHDRVLGFVAESLDRLLGRDDVAAVVVNAHSQGSVVCFDALQPLSTQQLHRVGAFITAGSPLRKYVDFFGHTRELSGVGEVPWLNFWDELDLVGDPLAPPQEWRPMSNPTVHAGDAGLFRLRRGGGFVDQAHVADRAVDNVANSSGGGMQAHDYWNNSSQFVAELARVLRALGQA
ncbi:MAG: hypothetical protein QOK05_489 [Chloroflexota bacterium]|jgi:hypothetical protein|nr:hypothetical protein [Chloroflexota bacterium]